MSWIEKITSGMLIITGDGKEYRPEWMNATVATEYNITEFDFPNIGGTLVKRTTNRGARYNIEIYFQGEDCLDISAAFRLSANDNRAWNFSHPLYGDLLVQPLGLAFDDSKMNASKITGTVVETITEEAPKGSIDPIDKINNDKENLNVVFEESFANTVVPDTQDKTTLTNNIFQIYSKSIGQIKDALQAEEYFNAFNEANALILDATDEPLAAIRAAQTFINAPALFSQNVESRINMLVSQFVQLRNSVINATSYSLKKIYENNGSMLISSLAVCTANPFDSNDYVNRKAVIRITEIVLENYNNFISDINSLQGDNGGVDGAYLPDSESILALNDLVNFSISNLFDIAFNAKQERSIILEDDSNLILLTHRFMGLDAADENIKFFMDTNNIGLNEILQIKKGREIIYFI